jgi:large subunit ribosomal protein L10
MPGRNELFSKLLFLINAPAQRLATVIAATGRDLAVVVNQAVEQNKFAGAAAPAVEAPAAEVSQTETKTEPAAPVAETPATVPAAAEPSVIAGEPSAIAEGAAPDVTGAPQADPAQPETGEASQAQSASTEAPVEG